MKRGTLIAAVVLAIGAFACERKHDDRAGETTTTSGTVREEQSTGTGYDYQGSPGVTGGGTTSAGNEPSGSTGATTGTDRNAQPSTGSTTSMGSGSDVSGSSLSADQSGSSGFKDAGIASDFDKKDGGHVAPQTGTSGTSKAKSGDNNNSTPLGDGTSGQYTGGKGTYGGKATHGTGDKK
jgi:hypothetical protein